MSSASTAVSTLPTTVTSGRFCTRPVTMIPPRPPALVSATSVAVPTLMTSAVRRPVR
jgi:hypothetical protein